MRFPPTVVLLLLTSTFAAVASDLIVL